jgi:hypothetical protein
LILLDCCSSGVVDGGEAKGVTELLAACPFGSEANGVGHCPPTTSYHLYASPVSLNLSKSLTLYAIAQRSYLDVKSNLVFFFPGLKMQNLDFVLYNVILTGKNGLRE